VAIILGVDPGSRKTGYGIIEAVGDKLRYIDCGVIRLPDGTLPERLKQIAAGLNDIIQIHCPTQASVEEVFMSNNPSSALKLGQARGAAIVAAVQNDLAVSEYTARQIKQSVVGSGAADKDQVQYMIRLLLKLDFNPQEDAADALAAAVCHAHSQQTLIRMSGAKRDARRRIR